MNSVYVVGFKDVYPWVWSVMLGVAWTLAERRGAFIPDRTTVARGSRVWVKPVVGVLLNVALPAIVFGLTMVRLGPLYSANMGFWQVIGVLFLAAVPMGSHHLWLAVAKLNSWLSDENLRSDEIAETHAGMRVHIVWVFVALVIPVASAIVPIRLPWWN